VAVTARVSVRGAACVLSVSVTDIPRRVYLHCGNCPHSFFVTSRTEACAAYATSTTVTTAVGIASPSNSLVGSVARS
jgi:hypothetical protein